MSNQIVLGIDVGGSHITIAPVDLFKKIIISKHIVRIDFNSNGDKNAILELWANAILKVANDCTIFDLEIGIAFPGPFDYDNGICLIKGQNKYEHFFNLNVKEELAKRLDINGDNIHFMNDAACFLNGEMFNNEYYKQENPLGIALGTGLGSAKIDNNQVVDAELWKMPFKNGIAEDYVSSRWFFNLYNSITGRTISSVKQLAINCTDSLDENERVICNYIFLKFGENIADFIAEVLPIIKPTIIILGGNVGKSLPLFLPSFNTKLWQYGYSIEIRLSQLGEDATVIGAAALCSKNMV